MDGKPVISLFLDKRRPLKSGEYPIKLRASFRVAASGRRTQREVYYRTSLSSTPEWYEAAMSGKFFGSRDQRDRQRDLHDDLISIQARANDILKAYQYVSIELFDRLFNGPGLRTIAGLFERVIADADRAGRIGTRDSYKSAMNNILTFGGSSLALSEINEKWLDDFSSWMKTKRKVRYFDSRLKRECEIESEPASLTTISIYKRNLRKVFNDAIADKLVSADLYPFGKRKHQIQEVQNNKVYLDEAARARALAFHSEDKMINWGMDFWKLSYFLFGINMADLLQLSRRQIKGGVLKYRRAKIKNTVRVARELEIPMREEVKKIISRWGHPSLDPDAYVFPVLEKGMSAVQQKYKIQDFLSRVNRELRKAAVKLEFDFKFTFGTARHTAANALMEKGYTDAEIQESLVHESPKTTQRYKGSFGLERRRKRVNDL